jgi:phosphohistidine swiveling domain-containing protein
VGKKVADQVERNDVTVEHWMGMVHERGEKLISFAKNIPAADSLSLDEIYAKIREYFVWFESYQPPLWHSFYVAEAASKAVLKMLQAEGIKNEAEVMSELSKPSKKAHVLKISEYFNRVRDISKRVEYLKDNYFWIGSADPLIEPYTDKQFHDYAMASVSDGAVGVKKIKAAKRIDVSSLDNRIIKMYQECLFIKDKRDEYRRILFHYMHPLFVEISRRLAISLDDLAAVFPDEWERLENDWDNLRNDISERRKGLVVEKNANGLGKWEGQEARQRMHIDTRNNGEIKEVKGISGSSGRATGRVQVISLANLNQFKEGNILVAVTTNPNFVPVMEKAAAFVTDEGGITCHAAIVAREMRKPCIIGTKIATKVLKDGDLVEVDADKGVVKFIRRDKA